MSSFDSTDEERSKKSTEALLDELKSSSKEQSETARSLDNRATNMITISATTTSLLIAFATALLSRIDTRFPFFNWISILLVIGLGLTISSIFIFLISARPRYGFSIIPTSIFFKEEGRLDQSILEKFIQFNLDDFTRSRIKEYLNIIHKIL